MEEIFEMTRDEFIEDCVRNYQYFTRGDLQGTVEAYALVNGEYEDEILEEIDERAEAIYSVRWH